MTDYLHFVSARGSAVSVKTLTVGGNASSSDRKEYVDKIKNKIQVLGIGTGINQIKSDITTHGIDATSQSAYGVREMTYTDRSITTVTVANEVADRIVESLKDPIEVIQFVVNPADFDFDNGDVVTLVDSINSINGDYRLINYRRQFGDGKNNFVLTFGSEAPKFTGLFERQADQLVDEQQYDFADTKSYPLEVVGTGNSTNPTRLRFSFPEEIVSFSDVTSMKLVAHRNTKTFDVNSITGSTSISGMTGNAGVGALLSVYNTDSGGTNSNITHSVFTGVSKNVSSGSWVHVATLPSLSTTSSTGLLDMQTYNISGATLNDVVFVALNNSSTSNPSTTGYYSNQISLFFRGNVNVAQGGTMFYNYDWNGNSKQINIWAYGSIISSGSPTFGFVYNTAYSPLHTHTVSSTSHSTHNQGDLDESGTHSSSIGRGIYTTGESALTHYYKINGGSAVSLGSLGVNTSSSEVDVLSSFSSLSDGYIDVYPSSGDTDIRLTLLITARVQTINS